MKRKLMYLTILLLSSNIVFIACNKDKDTNPVSVIDNKEYYFNQTLPGDSAVIFAPGIFSLPERLESNITFSPDGKEC